jgi:hypothetical protein
MAELMTEKGMVRVPAAIGAAAANGNRLVHEHMASRRPHRTAARPLGT